MPRVNAKQKLLDAAFALIRERGFSATTVDALCERAGVTKGAFFHHFKSKDELGVAAAEHSSAVTGAPGSQPCSDNFIPLGPAP